MGGGFSRQNLADHAANYTFRPLRKKSDKSNSSNENNTRPITDSISSPRRSTSNHPVITDCISSPRRSTPNDHVITDCISSPRRSTSNDNVITDCISSPRRSTSNDRVITDCTPSAKLLDNNEGGNKGDRQSPNSDRNPQSISSPARSISPLTNIAPRFENNSNIEQKESIHVFNSDISTPQKKDQEEDDHHQKESIHAFDSDVSTQQKKAQDKDDHKVEISYHEESDDDYGRRLSDYDGWIGSPSFREYCVKDFLKPDSNTCDGEMIETKTKGIKAKEDPIPMSTKKWRRIRKIKKVISMGNPSGMRNILNVSACYSPANSASHQKLVNQIEKNP